MNRYVWTLFLCAALAVGGVIICLAVTIPHGEGAFGVAKAVPMILLLGPPILFCLLWFPANLLVSLWSRRTRRDTQDLASPLPLLIFSGGVFVLCIVIVGKPWISAHQKHPALPEPQRQVQLKDIKQIIDDFCARERRGEKLTPADGLFATMEQLASLSSPEAIRYMADNLGDNSGFLWVIAGNPNLTPEEMTRFLSIPSTHRFLANNPAAPPQVLESLSHSTNSEVRTRIAANANTPKATLEQLADDPEGPVRDAAEKHLKPVSSPH